MFPILFQIKGFIFYTHGLLAVFGIIAGSWLLYYLAKKSGLKRELLFDNVVYCVLAGIIGARVTYFALYRDQFSSLKEILYLWDGGMVSYGGFILGALAFYLLLKSQKEPIAKWFDRLSISFSVGLFFGRIGNVMAGENAGILTKGKFNLDGYVPVTLYESILMLIIIGGLLLVQAKYRKLRDGILLSIFMISYGLGRFILDFWRDENNLILGISLGQVISFVVLAAGISMLVITGLKYRKVDDAAIA